MLLHPVLRGLCRSELSSSYGWQALYPLSCLHSQDILSDPQTCQAWSLLGGLCLFPGTSTSRDLPSSPPIWPAALFLSVLCSDVTYLLCFPSPSYHSPRTVSRSPCHLCLAFPVFFVCHHRCYAWFSQRSLSSVATRISFVST